jgi:hypothetical protein
MRKIARPPVVLTAAKDSNCSEFGSRYGPLRLGIRINPHKSQRHFCFAGPWMWRAFEERGFHKPGDPVSQLTKDIVTAILKRFADRLVGLEQK